MKLQILLQIPLAFEEWLQLLDDAVQGFAKERVLLTDTPIPSISNPQVKISADNITNLKYLPILCVLVNFGPKEVLTLLTDKLERYPSCNHGYNQECPHILELKKLAEAREHALKFSDEHESRWGSLQAGE